jgi:hypothetical protein
MHSTLQAIYYLYLIIKGARVPWFGSSVFYLNYGYYRRQVIKTIRASLDSFGPSVVNAKKRLRGFDNPLGIFVRLLATPA